MEKKRSMEKMYERAVVIGSGIAGLAAARVLREHFARVTLIDRDLLPNQPEFRPGIPQAHHAHTLLPYGQMLLEQQFPHLMEELLEQGALNIEEAETAYFDEGIWQRPRPHASRAMITCSRPMLETNLYRRVSSYPEIEILQGYEVNRLLVDEGKGAVSGVLLRSRANPAAKALRIEASLVIDASGRGSRAPQWLESLGYAPPEEWQINAYAGYASRLYEQPEGFEHDWKKLYISPCPPNGTRGGVIIPLEGGRWHATLIGIGSDYPPTDEEGFLEFARSLVSPALYEAIRAAKPVSKIFGYRKNENRVRRYECLPRYLEGFLVLGDAVFTMNPVYALGMTAAVVSSRVLETALQEQRQMADGLTGLAQRFQQQLARETAKLWQQAIQNEWRWPATDIADNTEEIYMQHQGGE